MGPPRRAVAPVSPSQMPLSSPVSPVFTALVYCAYFFSPPRHVRPDGGWESTVQKLEESTDIRLASIICVLGFFSCVGVVHVASCQCHSAHSAIRQMVWRIFSIFWLRFQMVVELIFRRGNDSRFWSCNTVYPLTLFLPEGNYGWPYEQNTMPVGAAEKAVSPRVVETRELTLRWVCHTVTRVLRPAVSVCEFFVALGGVYV